MPEIKLEKFERDCPANESLRKEGKRLIKDMRVFINGEYRALLSSRWGFHGSNGYHLFDIDHRPIHQEDNHWNSRTQGYTISSKAEIMPALNQALQNNRIPSMAKYAKLRQADAEAKAAQEKEIADRIAENKLHAGAKDLLDCLFAIKSTVHFKEMSEPLQAQINAAIAESTV